MAEKPIYEKALEQAREIKTPEGKPSVEALLTIVEGLSGKIAELREQKNLHADDWEEYKEKKEKRDKAAKEIISRCGRKEATDVIDCVDLRNLLTDGRIGYVLDKKEEGREKEEQFYEEIREEYVRLVSVGKTPREAAKMLEEDFEKAREEVRASKGEGEEGLGLSEQKKTLIGGILNKKPAEKEKIIREALKAKDFPFPGKRNVSKADLVEYLREESKAKEGKKKEEKGEEKKLSGGKRRTIESILNQGGIEKENILKTVDKRREKGEKLPFGGSMEITWEDYDMFQQEKKGAEESAKLKKVEDSIELLTDKLGEEKAKAYIRKRKDDGEKFPFPKQEDTSWKDLAKYQISLNKKEGKE